MNIYTFIMEFRGGTYINQVSANNIEESINVWSNQLDISQIAHFGQKAKENLIKSISNEMVTELNSVKNVWFFCITINVGFLMVNIVKTDVSED
nr:hypothetical protein [uncultured Emticicia sp.]